MTGISHWVSSPGEVHVCWNPSDPGQQRGLAVASPSGVVLAHTPTEKEDTEESGVATVLTGRFFSYLLMANGQIFPEGHTSCKGC